jgi:hemin uptake protein HemP
MENSGTRKQTLEGFREGGAPASGNPPEAAPAPLVHSSDLFGGSKRLVIRHEGREYSLLITRQGKLLLNRNAP